METFTLSVETDAGTYVDGVHYGTIESVARQCAVEFFHKRKLLKIGTTIITVALFRDGRIFDVYDGEWYSERPWHDD